MNTKGMLEERYKGVLHGTYPHTWVQPTTDSESSVHTEKLSSKPFACAGKPGKNWPCPSGRCGPTDAYVGGTFNKTGYVSEQDLCNRPTKTPHAKNLNLNSRDYAQYLHKVKANCDALHFPFAVNNGPCTQPYLTVQQAQQDGLFPL
jgi:hypothetical protein